MYTQIHIHMYIFEYLYMHMYVYIYVCIYIYRHTYIDIYNICIYILFLCIFVISEFLNLYLLHKYAYTTCLRT